MTQLDNRSTATTHETTKRSSDYLPIEDAAKRLAVGAASAACSLPTRRRSRARQHVASAHLGGGVVACKFGRSWRVRFPAD